MKQHPKRKMVIGSALFALAVACLGGAAAPALKVLPPTQDSEGRFWIYRNGPLQPAMPFSPYGWMSDATNLGHMITSDMEWRERPNTVFKATGAPERERCMKFKIAWDDANWAGVAFISGPDKPPWWGETNAGKYYNYSALAKKKLSFYARGERGGEIIKIQIGALAGKPFGDSLIKPIVSEEFKLTQDWVRHEVDLNDVPGAELARICNGFGIVAERSGQPSGTSEIVFYIDDVYVE